MLKLKFHGYGLLIGLGIWLAYETSVKLANKRKLKEKLVNNIFWWAVIGGIIGARIYHVIDWWQVYKINKIEILYLWQGGLGIWGAVIGGVIGLGFFYVFNRKRFKLSWWNLLDISLIGVPLGQALGRWGNFLNQELYGKVTSLPWGIKIDETGLRHQPLFLYESILCLGLFLIMWKLALKSKREGIVSGIYLTGYGLIRILLENLRLDSMIWKWNGIPMAIIMGITAMAIGGLICYKKRP